MKTSSWRAGRTPDIGSGNGPSPGRALTGETRRYRTYRSQADGIRLLSSVDGCGGLSVINVLGLLRKALQHSCGRMAGLAKLVSVGRLRRRPPRAEFPLELRA